MIIQALLVAGLLLAAAYTVRGRRTALSTAIRRVFVIAFFTSGVLVVLFPDLLTTAAHRVGVGRGTDLLLYALCIACVFTTIGTYRRFRELEDRFVGLSRAVALAEHRISRAHTDQHVDA